MDLNQESPENPARKPPWRCDRTAGDFPKIPAIILRAENTMRQESRQPENLSQSPFVWISLWNLSIQYHFRR
jgi:hypothetical protein